MSKKKVCDICGAEFVRGVQVKALHDGIAPWKKKLYVCEKCENVMKLLVLQHRRKKSFEL